MKIKKLEVGQMKANCYLVFDEKTQSALIIDPGDDSDYITRILSDLSVEPIAILATHGHFDHIMAVTDLKLIYDIDFYVNKNDEFLIDNMESSVKRYLGITCPPKPIVDKFFKSGKFHIDSYKFEIIKTPGHTPGSVSLYFPSINAIFVGDLVFSGGYVGRYDFNYSKKDQLYKSIGEILKLPNETIVYPGHGEETDVVTLKEYFKHN